MTSVRSPPPPRSPVSSMRSAVVGRSRRSVRSSSVAFRHAPSQSASRACGADGIRAYPTNVPTLSPDQQRAVTHPPGAVLVVGGAGTGKTTVIVERFVHRVREGTPPEAILVLGPTAPAADALRERIEDALEAAWGELAIHDAHGLCARLLRDEAPEAALDPGDLLLHAIRLLRDKPHVRARVSARWPVLLADDVHDADFAETLLLRLLAADRGDVLVTGDDDQAIARFRGAAAKNLRDFADEHPGGTLIRLPVSERCPQRVPDAARAVVRPVDERVGKQR